MISEIPPKPRYPPGKYNNSLTNNWVASPKNTTTTTTTTTTKDNGTTTDQETGTTTTTTTAHDHGTFFDHNFWTLLGWGIILYMLLA